MRGLVVLTALLLAACKSSGPATMDLAVAADLAIAAGDLGPGAECTFNRDCVAEARCACDVHTGCACELGPRGTGKNGVDPCTDGNDCASSLCVEGPGGVSYCSDECVDQGDCTGMLPVCSSIALLGRVCIRMP
jgi:hypothetical protein